LGQARTVLIHGRNASGIGAALARELASRGSTVGWLAAAPGTARPRYYADCRETHPKSECSSRDLADPGPPPFGSRTRPLSGVRHIDVW